MILWIFISKELRSSGGIFINGSDSMCLSEVYFVVVLYKEFMFSFYMDSLKLGSFQRRTCVGLHAHVSIRVAEFDPAPIAYGNRTAECVWLNPEHPLWQVTETCTACWQYASGSRFEFAFQTEVTRPTTRSREHQPSSCRPCTYIHDVQPSLEEGSPKCRTLSMKQILVKSFNNT